MEKAKNKASEIHIEMNDGSKKVFAHLTQQDLVNVKCDKDGGLNLIRGIISDDPNGLYIERRMFKRNPAKVKDAKIVMGNLSLPNTDEALMKLSDKKECYWKGKRIDFDSELIAGTALSPDEKRFNDLAKAIEKGYKPNAEEKTFMQRQFNVLMGIGKKA